MALDGCGLVCKYILFIVNIIFTVVGFALLGLGLYLRFNNSTRGMFSVQELNSSAFVIGVIVLITLGSILIAVVVFGDYGSCNEKRGSLQVFSALLAILAGAVVVVGVLTYYRSAEVASEFGKFYFTLYSVYGTSADPIIGITLAFIQKMFNCCGVTGFKVIEVVHETCPKQDGFFKQILADSCPYKINNLMQPFVTGIFCGTGALLITGLVCSIILLKKIKKSQQAITAYYSAVY